MVIHLAVQHWAWLVYQHASFTTETNLLNERNRVKNPNWQEADQLAIYKAWSGIWTRDYWETNDSCQWLSGGLMNQGPLDYNTCTQSLNHSATLPTKSMNFVERDYFLIFANRPFARSGHMARNKLHWDTNDAVGLSKQRKVGLDWYEFLCFWSPTAPFASQCNLFRTMWPDRAKGLLLSWLKWLTWKEITSLVNLMLEWAEFRRCLTQNKSLFNDPNKSQASLYPLILEDSMIEEPRCLWEIESPRGTKILHCGQVLQVV